MLNLLKVDLKRIIKDKLFLVACIIGIAFSVFTPLLYRILFSEMMASDDMGLFASLFSTKGIFFNSFSLTNNFGLIVPIFLMIIIFKDFNQGTIRNKIITGKSRVEVFLSMFLSIAIVIVGVVLAHAIISGVFAMALFPDSVSEVTLELIQYYAISICFEILILISIAALLSFVVVFMKNLGLAIISYVAIILLSTAIYGVIEIASMIVENETTLEIMGVLEKINIFSQNTSIISVQDSYSSTDILYVLFSNIFMIGLFGGLGILSFNKKDIK